MKNNNYKIFGVLFLGFSIGLFILFVFSVFSILINQEVLQFQPDSKGFIVFLNLYSPSFKIGTASIVFFTLWLTLERMKQTQKQLELTSENVFFNNFFKHKEEFRFHLKNMPFIKDIKRESNLEIDVLLDPIYAYFFNKTYKNFSHELKQKSKNEIELFLYTINSSTISKQNANLEDVEITELKEIAKLFNQVIDPICSIYTNLDSNTVRAHFTTIGGHPTDLIVTKFKLLSNIYWSNSLFEDILAFNGDYTERNGTFALNFSNYRKNIGLQ